MARKRGKTAAVRLVDRRVYFHAAKVFVTLAAAAVTIAAIVWFGTQAGERVADAPRYAVPFADIECPSPPGRDRVTFLSEVRYLGNAAETVFVAAPELSSQLAALFRKHPWVDNVDGVDVTADRTVRVRLTFRTPVLLVRIRGGMPAERMVDASGVLLPPAPIPAGIAILVNEQPPPSVQAGREWDDSTVKRAAALAREFKALRVEKTDKGWRVTESSGRVLSVSW